MGVRVGASNTQMASDKDKITSRLMFIDFRGSVNIAPRHTQSNGCCRGWSMLGRRLCAVG